MAACFYHNVITSVFVALDDDRISTPQWLVDQVREYVLAVMFYGLTDMCHRDYIWEAVDRLGMMSMWRIDMLHLWDGNHFKYLNAGHRQLAGLATRLLMSYQDYRSYWQNMWQRDRMKQGKLAEDDWTMLTYQRTWYPNLYIDCAIHYQNEMCVIHNWSQLWTECSLATPPHHMFTCKVTIYMTTCS